MRALRRHELIYMLTKRAIILIAVPLIVFSMPTLLQAGNAGICESDICVFAASNDGADAHSESMSVGSGDPEVNAEKKTAESDVEDEPSEYDDSQVTGDDGFGTGDVVKTGDEAARELDVEDDVGIVDISKEDKTEHSWIRVAAIAVALMSLGAAILLFRSRRKDKKSGISRSDKKYVSKH